jgi:phospholipid/cholesterol/gamma-HCH transport system substrate-binding protein
MGKHPSLMIAAVAILSVALVVAFGRPAQFHLTAKCYFQNAEGLRAGAKVRLAGVEIGSVTNVRVRPELGDHPAEIVMSLQTPYELKIPNDSVVTLETAGVLGDAFPEIDVRGASGPALLTNGELKTRSSENPSTQDLLKCFSNMAEHKPCDLRTQGVKSDGGQETNSTIK